MQRFILLFMFMHTCNCNSICGICPACGCCAGYYINPERTTSTAQCIPCPVGSYCPCAYQYCDLYTPLQCPAGYFTNVTTTTSLTGCIKWQTCPAQTYISREGNSSSDRVCSPCLSFCPVGMYVYGQTCLGLEYKDGRTCRPCLSTCPQGQHLNFQCNGNTTELNTCVSCTVGNCPSGYYRTTCNATADGVCMPCVTCPAGQFNSACNSTFQGICSNCTVCTPGHAPARTCGQFTDTICTNAACNTTTSCAPLFCNYGVSPVADCGLTWVLQQGSTQILQSTGSFLCVRSDTQGLCQPCPVGWTAAGAYCVPCDSRYSCDTFGQEVCVGACSPGYSPECDPFIGQTTCTPCSLNSTMLTIQHMTVTRGGILNHPELCSAYSTCAAGYYMKTVNNTNACDICQLPDPFATATNYVFVTPGLTDQDQYSCLYTNKVQTVSTNYMGMYGGYGEQCPPGYTSQANLAAVQTDCTRCVYTPDNGYVLYRSTQCNIACNQGYTLMGQSCINLLTLQCDTQGYTRSTTSGACLSMQLPWNLPGNLFTETYDVSEYSTGNTIIAMHPASMFAATTNQLYYMTDITLNSLTRPMCNLARTLPGSITDAPITAINCVQLEYHQFYMVHRGSQFFYAFLQRSFGNNNRYIMWKIHSSGKVVSRWRLPGMTCSVASGVLNNMEYLYISFCNTTFVAYLNATLATVSASSCTETDANCIYNKCYDADPAYKVNFNNQEGIVKVGFAVGVLAGVYTSGMADGLRDTARFKGPISLATSQIYQDRVFVADYDNCRLAEIVIDYPGSWLTSTRTIKQSCYSQTGAVPFPSLLTSVLNGALLLFLTDKGLVQMDVVSRQMNLILGLSKLPVAIRWFGASADTVYIWSTNTVTVIQRTVQACPPHHISRPGGACTPCAADQYASADVCVQCSVQHAQCQPGYIWNSCGNNSDAACLPCSTENLPPTPFIYTSECNTALVQPCPLAYFSVNGICQQCPPWSTTANNNATSITECSCLYNGTMNKTSMTCSIPSPYSNVIYTESDDPLQSWTSALGCENLKGALCTDCPANGIYLSSVVPRVCSMCPPHSVGTNGLWCKSCPALKEPSTLQDTCVCTAGASMTADTTCLCNAGHYKSEGGCILCPSNTFNAYKNSDVLCIPCPLGSVAAPGSTACTPCAPGLYRGMYMDTCRNCTSYVQYATDATDARSCTSCTSQCSHGMLAEQCPRGAPLYKCSQCPRILGQGERWVQDPYNTNCLWECLPGYYMSGDTCSQCTSRQCTPGTLLTPCSRYSDSSCTLKCVNESMPFMNAEWGPDCTWRCMDGFELITKTFMNWIEYMCYTPDEVLYSNRWADVKQ